MTETYTVVVVWDDNPEIDIAYYEVFRAYTTSYPITALSIADDWITIAGDQTAYFPVGTVFNIINSTGNDKECVVEESVYDPGGFTKITITGDISDPTVDGSLYLFKLVDKPRTSFYADRELPTGTYYYKIRVIDTMGNESAFSAVVTKTAPMDAVAPAVPTGLIARRFDDYAGVKLNWNHSADTDLRGYLVWRTFDGLTWNIIAKISKNEYKDNDIPLGRDALYRCTYVTYAISSYDRDNNQSVSTSPTDTFIIPDIKGVSILEDYLSLNVYWRAALSEDDISAVQIWYKKSSDSTWILAETVEYPLHAGSIDGPLDKDTAYDVALVVVPARFSIKSASIADKFFIEGDWADHFNVGDTVIVENTPANDGIYTVFAAVKTLGEDTTQIFVNEEVPADQDEAGTIYNTVPRTIRGEIASIYTLLAQEPIRSIKIADYPVDSTPPTITLNPAVTRDLKNNRLYVSWARNVIDDDFLYFQVELWNEVLGTWELYDKTTKNNLTIYNADLYKYVPSGYGPYQYIISWRVAAVDRTGNVSSYTDSSVAMYEQLFYNQIAVPEWGAYTERDLSDFKNANDRLYNLMWNDCARYSDFFKRYVLYYVSLVSEFAITVADIGNDHFTIAGDYTATFLVGDTFVVTGSTGNDGTWTVDHTVLNAGNTEIYTDEDITDATADGKVLIPANAVIRAFTFEDGHILAYTNYAQFDYQLRQATNYYQYIWPAVEDWFGAITVGLTASIITIPYT